METGSIFALYSPYRQKVMALNKMADKSILLVLVNGLILTLVYSIQYVSAECPDGFMVHQDSCYKEFGIKTTWPEASMICRVYGGYLANIESEQEQLYVSSYLARLGKDSFNPGTFWLGATDLQTEGLWSWTRGSSGFLYKNWHTGEPNNEGGDENCLCFGYSTGFKWNDNNCQNKLNFICELPSNQP